MTQNEAPVLLCIYSLMSVAVEPVHFKVVSQTFYSYSTSISQRSCTTM